MKHIVKALMNWFSESESAELERYLAQSVSAEDVERRLREWDSRYRHSSRHF